MVEAVELQALTPALTIWQAYDPAVRAELASTAISLGDRLYVVDPIPLAAACLKELTASAGVAGIFVTNVNHVRAAAFLAGETGSAVLASAMTASLLYNVEIVAVAAGDAVGERIEVAEIEGAAEGEIALYVEDDGGSVILGDALINFGNDGFALLPAKYCLDQKQLRRSLRQLLDFSFERMLFAHGAPVVSSARARLAALLD